MPLLRWLTVLALFVATSAALAALSEVAINGWGARPRPGAQVRRQFVAKDGEGTASRTRRFNYLLYLPRDYYEGRLWPLVVFLHGLGNPETEVRLHGPPHLVDGGKQFDFILLSPECADSRWEAKEVLSLIKHVSNSFSVDADRVYLTGLSAGGVATWNITCDDPGRFAAIAPLCGGGDVAKACRLKNVPVWAFHGGVDLPAVIEANTAMVAAVKKCGGRRETYGLSKERSRCLGPGLQRPATLRVVPCPVASSALMRARGKQAAILFGRLYLGSAT